MTHKKPATPSLDNAGGSDGSDRDEEALRCLASDLGISPDELDRRIEARFAGLHVTDNCLSLDEVEKVAVLGQLNESRDAHVSGCGFCQELLAALHGDPNTEKRVLESAAEAEPTRRRGFGAGLVSGFVASGAILALRHLLSAKLDRH